MKKIFMLVFLLVTTLFGQGYNPYNTTGWDAPYGFTGQDITARPPWANNNGYYGLGIMRINSHPGGWLNYNYWKIDSLLQALVVYTDTTQIIVKNDTLMLSESAAARLDTGFSVYSTIDTTAFMLDDDTLKLKYYWDDLRISIDRTKAGSTNQPDWAKIIGNGSTSQGVWTYWFSASSEEELYFMVQLPHGWLEGDSLHPHIHWIPKTTEDSTTTVSWGLEYTWCNINSTIGNTNIIYATSEDSLQSNYHYMTEFSAIDGSGKTISSMLACRIFRNATDTTYDTYSYDAGVLEFDFHIRFDKNGSRTETHK